MKMRDVLDNDVDVNEGRNYNIHERVFLKGRVELRHLNGYL